MVREEKKKVFIINEKTMDIFKFELEFIYKMSRVIIKWM